MLKIVYLEDSYVDFELISENVYSSCPECEISHAVDRESFISLITSVNPDLVLSDFELKQYDGVSALKDLRSRSPFTPFILLSGVIDDETAVSVLKQGATDYILKDNLVRLPSAIERALKEYETLVTKEKAQQKLVENEAFYRQFVTLFPGIVFKRDTDFNFQYIVGQVLPITGYSSEELMSGEARWHDIISEEDRTQYLHEDEHFNDSDNSVLEHSFRIVRKDGDIRWLKRFVQKAEKEPGVLNGFILDVTQEKEFEKMFFQMQKMNAIGKLAGGIAHDFNNILTGVFGYLDMLKRSNSGSGKIYDECIDGLDLSVGKASALVKQLLAFSRNQRMDLEYVDVNRSIQELQGLIHQVVPKEIQVQLDLSEGIETIYADKSQLDQVLLNLVINGKDAILEKDDAFEKQIRISTALIDVTIELSKNLSTFENIHISPGKYVVISVVDTGGGIDKEMQHRIFEPFFTTKEKGKGTGLGLSAVYGIVKQNNGWVTIDSAVGFGTTFEIYWPTKVRQSLLNGDSKKDIYDGLFHGTETVLVAAEDGSIRKIFGIHAKSLGFNVLEADNEASVLNHMCAESPVVDIVMLDHIVMSEGFSEWLDQLLSINPNVRLVISSYYDDVDQFVEGRVHWVTLKKPFTIEKLASTLQEVSGA